MSEFDDLIRVRREQDESRGGLRYVGALSEGWSIGAAINGGAVLAVVGSALRDLLGSTAQSARSHPDPLTVAAVFLSPGTDGPCEIATEVLRRGGRTSVASATLRQDGTDKVRVLATYTDLDLWQGETHLYDEQPPIPAPGDCFGSEKRPEGGPTPPPLTERLDLRFDPACIGWALGEPARHGMLQAQVGFADGRDWDPVSLLLATDTLLPTTTDMGLYGWAPTVELTVHLRAKPAPGYLHVRHATRFMSGGLFEEDAEIWDSSGTLVAQSRQLALLPAS